MIEQGGEKLGHVFSLPTSSEPKTPKVDVSPEIKWIFATLVSELSNEQFMDIIQRRVQESFDGGEADSSSKELPKS